MSKISHKTVQEICRFFKIGATLFDTRFVHYWYKLSTRNKKLNRVWKAWFELIHWTWAVVRLLPILQRVVMELSSARKSLRCLRPDALWGGIFSHTRDSKGERAPALRQHLRFGTHERCKPTSIGRKAACKRERWMRTDDVKWIGQTDRRDRHNSPVSST